jgi:hypothetical protein
VKGSERAAILGENAQDPAAAGRAGALPWNRLSSPLQREEFWIT